MPRELDRPDGARDPAASDETSRSPLGRRDALLCAALALATLALYAQTPRFEFVNWDDPLYVTHTPQVLAGLQWKSIAWAFSDTQRAFNWHPLTWLSHMLDVELFGTNPAGHHATSALLHALDTALVYIVLRALTGAVWRSALVAALFGVHPLHVESVAWVSERKDVLSTFFGLLAIRAYAAYVRRPGIGRQLGVVVLFALSLLSKAMLVSLPLILLLLDDWPLRRRLRPALLLEKLPLIALSVAASAMALRAQGEILTESLSLPQRLANAAYSYVAYLGMTLWPQRLGILYPHPYLPDTGGTPLAVWQVGAACALIAAITLAALAARNRRYLLVGWLWYGISLVPVIGLVHVGRQGLADRYTYFPLIGIFIIAAWGGADLLEALRRRAPRLARVAVPLTLGVLVWLSAVAWQQIATWRDSFSLFSHAVQASPRNPTIRFNLANRLRDRGRLDEAIAEYRRTLEDTPDNGDAHVNLANSLRRRGDAEGALRHYRAALALDPGDAMAHVNLGALLAEQGELDEAEVHYREALRISPEPRFAYNLANLLRRRGDLDGAIALYEQVVARQPTHAKAHNNLGSALQDRGDSAAALRHFRSACQLDPRNHRAYNNAGMALLELRELEEAARYFRRALELEPDYALAHANLGRALEQQGAVQEAIASYRRALELAPDDAETRERLAKALDAALSARSGSPAP